MTPPPSHQPADGGPQAARFERLLEFAQVLLSVQNHLELADVLTDAAAPMIGATNAGVAVHLPGEGVIAVYQGATATLGTAGIRRVDLAERTPLTDVIRHGEPVVVSSFDDFARDYPKIAVRIEPAEVVAMPTFPATVEGAVVGSYFLRYSGGQKLDSDSWWYLERIRPLVDGAFGRIADRNRLLDQAQQLAQSNRDLNDFAAVAAHDLSGPVRRIGSMTQLLIRELQNPSEKAIGYADTIVGQVSHLDELLRDTLNYAKLASSVDTRTQESIRRVLDEVLENLKSDIGQVGAVVRIGDLPTAYIEGPLIRQLFADLIQNSIKYRRVERPLEIHVDAEHLDDIHERDWWRVSVRDNGIGIDPDREDEVFRIFTRLEVSQDRPGTGIGLAVVKRTVERHGGTVGIGPGIDGGAAIWFTLPGEPTPDLL